MMNIILSGVGGQGTVLASKLIAQSAIGKGLDARTAETIGMAQRGGCVVSHVRIGKNIHSPLIPLGKADAIIGFEPAEAVRVLDYLKDSGIVIVGRKAIKPVTSSLSGIQYDGSEMLKFLKSRVASLIVIDTEAICADCGSAKVLNTALLGAAAATGRLGVTVEELSLTVQTKLPSQLIDINIKALRKGAETVVKENLS